jgi:hypothetical protein
MQLLRHVADQLVPETGGYHLPGTLSLPDDRAEPWLERLRALGLDAQGWAALELAGILGPRIEDVLWADACERAGIQLSTGVLAALLRAGHARRSGAKAWVSWGGMRRRSRGTGPAWCACSHNALVCSEPNPTHAPSTFAFAPEPKRRGGPSWSTPSTHWGLALQTTPRRSPSTRSTPARSPRARPARCPPPPGWPA